MTTRISLRNPFRALAWLLVGCLAALPLAAAAEVSHDDIGFLTEKGSCTRRTYVGSGWLDHNRQDWVIRGGWTDGCGGKACDDEAHGTVYDKNGTARMTFSITEVRKDGDCKVQCGVSGRQETRDGYVDPYRSSHGYINFECGGVFIGHMGDGTETLAVLLRPAEPILGA